MTKTCEQCGEPFERPGMSKAKWEAQRFCCRACVDASRRGRKSRRPVNGQECMIDGCTTGAKCRGMCNTHYRAWARYGDPLYRGKPGRKKVAEVRKRERFVVVRTWQPVVTLGPDSTPVTCPDCGAVYSATDNPILASDALYNHRRFHTKEKAA